MRILIVVCILMSVFLSGCSKDPMNALKSSSVDKSFTYQFWSQQYSFNTPLWHEAVTYCLSNSDKPNCDFVMNIYMSGTGNKKPPKIGQSGESIHMEMN